MGRLRFGSLTLACLALAAACAAAPADWASLDRYQQTITRADFEKSLKDLYCPSGAMTNYLEITPDSVRVFSTADRQPPALFELKFAGDTSTAHPVPRTFKTVDDLHQLHNPPGTPLRGLRIVLDPGHIGGEWARMEERFFQLNDHDRPVQEAVLNLTVAHLLQQRLEAAGATVLYTKNNFLPVTDKRPDDFHVEAEQDVAKMTNFNDWPSLDREAGVAETILKRQETLFYRKAEIAARAQLANDQLKPDLTLCIHFNAVAWNDHFELVDDNRVVVFVHGDYLPDEVQDDDQKLRLFQKLLEGSHPLEIAAAESIATSLAEATRLPPVEYGPASGSIRCGHNRYVYARNLAAPPPHQRPRRLPRTLLPKQPHRLSAHPARRLPRHPRHRRQTLPQHLPRIRQRRRQRPDQFLFPLAVSTDFTDP
jgi:N-acetylmuramoyl-L-alanine amidase